MMRWWGGIVAGLLMGVLATTVLAADSRTSPQPSDQVDQVMARYNLHPSFEKLGRGLGNAFMGWAEIPLGVQQRYSKEDTGSSFFAGLAIGLFKGVVRTGVGVYETVTFLLPYPDAFRPILPTRPYYQLIKNGKPRDPLPLE